MATEGSGLVLLEQRAAAAEARLTALEAALAGIARTPDHLTILRGGQRPAAQTDVQRRCRRSVGTHLRAEEPGGAPAAGAAPSAHGAAANAADGRSLPGKYVTELTSIRAALLKASEEQSAMQNQLKEAALRADKQEYRIQHIIKAYRESEARREAAEAELSASRSGVTA